MTAGLVPVTKITTNTIRRITTPEVRARQRAELTSDEAQRLDTLVREAMRDYRQRPRDGCC
jgi:hypothetical protein